MNTIQEIELAIEALTPVQREQLYQWIECRQQQAIAPRPETAAVDAGRVAAQQSVVEEMRVLRSHVGPDADGWTTRDYVNHGRH